MVPSRLSRQFNPLPNKIQHLFPKKLRMCTKNKIKTFADFTQMVDANLPQSVNLSNPRSAKSLDNLVSKNSVKKEARITIVTTFTPMPAETQQMSTKS